MERKLLSLVVAAGFLLLGSTGTVFAGIEPSPWQPEINKLHSIELNMALVQKSLDNLVISPSLPRGIKSVLLGVRYDLYVLDAQLANVLAELPPNSELGVGQRGVYLALEGIRINALSMEDPFDYILWRMGVEPSPWKEILDSMSSRISDYTSISCIPGIPCP
jgi:hypothetical protein